MEILLAIIVAAAVIFFGALISIGNERQRKAIDVLREQVVLWAIQDLKIKRKHLMQTVEISDPLGWLNITLSKVCGYDLKLQVLEVIEEPQLLVCASGNGEGKVILSPFSPAALVRSNKIKRNRLLGSYAKRSSQFIPQKENIFALTIVNCGTFFDLEVVVAWKNLTGQVLLRPDTLWVYFLE